MIRNDPLGPVAFDLVAELNHEINSPLAAIRNALYLAACRSSDPELHRYLELANQEISVIAGTLHKARLQAAGVPRARAATVRAAA